MVAADHPEARKEAACCRGAAEEHEPGGGGGGPRRSFRRLLTIVFQVLIIAGLVGSIVGYAIIPSWQGAVNDVIGSVRRVISPELVAVNTAGQATGPALKGHPAQHAVDGFSNTYWAAAIDGSTKPAIEATFSPATAVDKILVTSGASDDFEAYARPRTIRVELLGADGDAVATKIELKDTKDLQAFDLSGRQVARIRLTVLDVYASAKRPAVAITEIEFRASR